MARWIMIKSSTGSQEVKIMPIDNETSLKGQIAIVTGGSGGIGRAISEELALNGCRVVIIYHEHDMNANNVASSIRERGGEADPYQADVTHYRSVHETFTRIKEKYERTDILVNCAGITRDRTLMKMTPEEWNEVIDVNLTGTFNCTKAVLDGMRANNYGRIVNVSSVVAQAGNFGQTNYCASKAGLIGFTKALALETAKFDITVNSVAPGFTETNMTKSMPENVLNDIVKRVPKGRLCQPIEIAKAVAFLCSPTSGFITGQVLGINGGLYM